MISIQIAIDGPAGAGKSTIAKILADRLGYLYIDTGAMYRAVTLAAFRQGVPLFDEESLANLAQESRIELSRSEDGNQQVFLNGDLVSEEIRQPLINQNVSLVAKLPKVRTALVHKQREMAENHNVVMDGRDVGTVVLPSADLKIFLTATLDERAKRRYKELLTKGFSESLEDVKAEMQERDKTDSTRNTSPLSVADDAITVDTTDKTLEEVVEIIVELLGSKVKESEHEIL
ncbi:MAG: (d)CMP kinase [Peptococcia bacterium]